MNTLPDGCFVQIKGSSYLVLGEALLRWSEEGYINKLQRPTGLIATVLTPEPIVQCIRQGYTPTLHASAATVAVWEKIRD